MAEQFQSLYRRYRPQRFSEVRGQGHVVLGLRNAVRDDRVAHAYLFSGPRGTGKTSTARILAKALNCAKPEDGEPCGQCDSCIDIARGASLDVHELDAASNNGVDAMRDLVARAALATPGKWKVYIVDEVHMLSTAASNALLKTLEEPPGHVVFVLATTDPQKVLPTIRSRTQHFEFHLLEASILETLLSDIADDAHLELPPDGIEAAVRRAHGSARDALSALDLVAAAGVVEDENRFVRELIAAIADRDTRLALHTVDAAMVAGFDAGRLAAELVDGLRDVFLSAMAPDLRRPNSVVAAPSDPAGPLVGPARCVRALEVIGTAIVDMREALDARTTFEVGLVRLTHPEVDDGPAALLERIERLERRLQELTSASAGQPAHAASRPPESSSPRSPAAATQAERPAPVPETAGRRPGAPVSGASPALGAFRRPAPPAAAAEAATAAPPPVATPAPSPQVLAEPPSSSPTVADTAPPGASASSAVLPTRDDLVLAWGDHVLSSLKPRARAVYTAGRFVAMEDGIAVFALPNAMHVEHAAPLVDEVAEAITLHVGVPVGLRLVTEAVDSPAGPDAAGSAGTAGARTRKGTDPVTPPTGPADRRPQASRRPSTGSPPPVEVEAEAELSDFDDVGCGEVAGRHDSLSWAEGRLLEAFPGAEEVP
ncbi:MAG TPA: DNA polymerase III subunit gamma/tau [Acidimicrobiales bacterium]|nr:DNA polymerase III subunit gamma/tau [Acidimicrobiales bacterium]